MADDRTQTPDDYILPFQIESSGARGRLVRMGPAISDVLGKHDYPEAVSAILGEAMTLTAMLGASLKFDGKFILQTSSQGPISFLVAHYHAPGNIRGYASYDEAAFDEDSPEKPSGGALLGEGHLAMTIDQGPEMERYQGIVPLEGGTLSEAADLYFRQSEQLPTFIKIAIARQYEGGKDNKPGSWSWRAGGLMVQKLTEEGGAPRTNGHDAEDAWTRSRLLAETVEDHELLDASLAPERLLYRLFHEEQVRAFPAMPISAFCQCSRERVEQMLENFSQEDIEDMTEDGKVKVTCQFCNTRYDFDAGALRAKDTTLQ
ncbi:MAG: Hsp33 family molecular chaperone [Rhodomicrobium sp.]|nr:Hsp33 family molecular chaperone [Rhodomicrobium sp.]